MCYSLMHIQSRARSEEAQEESTPPAGTSKLPPPTGTAARQGEAADQEYSDLMRSLQRLAKSRRRKEEEPVF